MNITSKYRSLSVQAKAALWFTICSFLQKGISFITVPIFTRLMSTEEYGTYTVYLSWLQILTIMTSLYLFNGVYDNAMAKYEKQRDEYTSAMQGLTLVITGAVFALYCFTSGFWEKILNLPKSMILLMFLEALLSPALSYWSGRQRFEYRYRILVCVTILQALMNPIASLVLIRINGGTAMMRILGIVGVQICICVPIIVFQFCKGKEFFSKEYWGYALRIGIPIVPHYLSGIILNQRYEQCIDTVDVQQDQKGRHPLDAEGAAAAEHCSGRHSRGADADQPGAGADFRITEVPRGGVRHSAGGSECVLYLHL